MDTRSTKSDAASAKAHKSGGTRDWDALRGAAALIALRAERDDRMSAFIELVWERMATTGLSWVGFYVADEHAPESERLVLAAREPKPACSPISLQGACGKTLLSGVPLVVHNVRDLGAAYIACDPRDQSELVLPCVDPDGFVWGVLDLDSHEIGSFCINDAQALVYLLKLAGLSA